MTIGPACELDDAAPGYWTPNEIRALEDELDSFIATGRTSLPTPNRLYGARINEDGDAV